MDNRITRYDPTTSMSAVNVHFNRFLSADELTVVAALVKECILRETEKYPALGLRLQALFWRYETPVLQIRLRHEYREKRMFDAVIRKIDDCLKRIRTPVYIKEIRITATPHEM